MDILAAAVADDLHEAVLPLFEVRRPTAAMRRGHRVIGPEQIEARYGVPPSAWCCQTGLAGDPSDGIKGIPGRHRSDHRPDRRPALHT